MLICFTKDRTPLERRWIGKTASDCLNVRLLVLVNTHYLQQERCGMIFSVIIRRVIFLPNKNLSRVFTLIDIERSFLIFYDGRFPQHLFQIMWNSTSALKFYRKFFTFLYFYLLVTQMPIHVNYSTNALHNNSVRGVLS